jgi:integrase
MPSDLKPQRKPNWPANFMQRGTKFYASVRIPESLRGVVTGGRQTHIRRSLKTTKEAEALRRFPLVLAEIKAQLETARRDASGALIVRSPPKPSIDQDAAWWREHLRSEGIDPADAMRDDAFSETVWGMLGDPVGSRWDGEREHPVYDPERDAASHKLVDLVTGRRVPVATELERFIADKAANGKMSGKYEARVRRAVTQLAAWLDDRRQDNLAVVDRREAGLYAEHLSATHKSPQTVSSLLTSLSSYWRWMERRGLTKENPWRDQSPELRTAPTDADKRPFTDAEVRQLLTGETYTTLHDMMRIAALSGMRIEEIGRLTVADCEGGVFNVRVAKTKAGVRRVPIHPDLGPVVARRTAGKDRAAFLIEELRPVASGERSAKASERFTDYRRRLGVDERGEGQRQSNIDFHSWRRWFATKAEEAGQEPHIISAVVGHKLGRQGMTLGVYSGGPSEEQMRAVVESVRLPPGIPAEKTDRPRMGDGRWPQRTASKRED